MANIFAYLFGGSKKKPKAGGETVNTVLKKATKGNTVNNENTQVANVSHAELRSQATDDKQTIRDYAGITPELSQVKEAITRFCITSSFTSVAHDMETGLVDTEATKAVQTYVRRLNFLPTYVDGHSPQSSIPAVSEGIIQSLILNGSSCTEIVLDKQQLPSVIQCIPTDNLEYEKIDDYRAKPFITQQGEKIYLDFPTIYINSLSQDPNSLYAETWFKSAIHAIIANNEFMDDLRRTFRRASLPRTVATIHTDKLHKIIPPSIMADDKKFAAELNKLIDETTNVLNGLAPEDSLAHFDAVSFDTMSPGNISAHDSVQTHNDILQSQQACGLHSLPAIIGNGTAGSNTVEAVIFLKICHNLQGRLNEVISRHLTTAIRLMGHDVTVSFKYKAPSLRPEIEEASFESLKQAGTMEKLSYGFISDEEASLELTGALPTGNFAPLSGTQFYSKNSNTGAEANPYSNTSVTPDGVTETADQKTRSKTDSQPATNKTTG